ncbi:MAG TPA: cupin domain-containing protein [Acidobacteriota bacterium]|jgi:quercetin dioxygenase-like cupin family protein
MKTNPLNSIVKLGAGLSVLFLAGIMSTYAATTAVIAVGTIPHSELFDGPATLTVRQLVISPGEVLAWHYHPGRAYNVIKRGTLTVEDGCGQEEVFKAGEAFEETELHVHRAKNLGTEDVEVYNTFIVPQGNPTTVNTPNNERRCGSLVPVLTLEATRFCPGSPWTLAVTRGLPNTSVHLVGTSSGKPWKTLEWGRTDSTGNLSVRGIFTDGNEGHYTLRVEIGGLLSDPVSFAVSKCAP